MALSDETRDKLKGVSVATITTALFKRGLRNQFIQNVHPLNPTLGNMVGEAFTLRYIPAREDLNPISVFRDQAHPQRRAIEECPRGAVMVIDSRKDARAASAGSILIARLMQRGCAGIVTDGGFRDSPDIARLAIPAHLADEVAAEAVEMTAFEDFVTEEVMKGRSILGLYPPTDPQAEHDFLAWRKARGR